MSPALLFREALGLPPSSKDEKHPTKMTRPTETVESGIEEALGSFSKRLRGVNSICHPDWLIVKRQRQVPIVGALVAPFRPVRTPLAIPFDTVTHNTSRQPIIAAIGSRLR